MEETVGNSENHSEGKKTVGNPIQRRWRILIDRACGGLRLTLFDPRLSPEQTSALQADLTFACLQLRQEGPSLVEYENGNVE